jgi:hypothetical protein
LSSRPEPLLALPLLVISTRAPTRASTSCHLDRSPCSRFHFLSSRPEPLSEPQASRMGRSGETPVFAFVLAVASLFCHPRTGVPDELARWGGEGDLPLPLPYSLLTIHRTYEPLTPRILSSTSSILSASAWIFRLSA